jgi:hypothetical protein
MTARTAPAQTCCPRELAAWRAGGQFYLIADSLIAILTLMMAAVAGLGVLNTVLLGTRDRVHDLGMFKAVGMTPRQTIAMVLCWVVTPAVVAAVLQRCAPSSRAHSMETCRPSPAPSLHQEPTVRLSRKSCLSEYQA